MNAEHPEVKYDTENGEVKLTPGIVRRFLVSGGGNVTDSEIVMFLKFCQYRKMNPFLRECYLIKYGNESASIVTGKEYFTKKAESIKTYNGYKAGIYVLSSGKIDKREGSCYFEGEKLVGGWAEVYREDRKDPIIASVRLDEYIGLKKDGTPNRQWRRMPATMIRKVALVQAHREAYPQDFQGLLDATEVSLNETDIINPTDNNGQEREEIITDIENILLNNYFAERRPDILEKVDKTKTVAGLNAIKNSLNEELEEAIKAEADNGQTADIEDAEVERVDDNPQKDISEDIDLETKEDLALARQELAGLPLFKRSKQ